MKKSEIINYLNQRRCVVKSYERDWNQLNVNVKYLSSANIEDLSEKGLNLFILAKGNELIIEMIGNIEWD